MLHFQNETEHNDELGVHSSQCFCSWSRVHTSETVALMCAHDSARRFAYFVIVVRKF